MYTLQSWLYNHARLDFHGHCDLFPETFIDVWGGNLVKEFARLREIVKKYPFVAMVSR